MLSVEQYLSLSQLAYLDFPDVDPDNSIALSMLLSDYLSAQESGKYVYDAIEGSSMSGWSLVETQPNTLSGFAGSAFQGPNGQIVFAFRGTEMGESEDLITQLQDIINDIQIGLPGSSEGDPNQFGDAYAFVKSTIESVAGTTMTEAELKSYIQQHEVTFWLSRLSQKCL